MPGPLLGSRLLLRWGGVRNWFLFGRASGLRLLIARDFVALCLGFNLLQKTRTLQTPAAKYGDFGDHHAARLPYWCLLCRFSTSFKTSARSPQPFDPRSPFPSPSNRCLMGLDRSRSAHPCEDISHMHPKRPSVSAEATSIRLPSIPKPPNINPKQTPPNSDERTQKP